MSEIDVSKCKHYKNRTCMHDYLTTDLVFDEAKCNNSQNCYYKQLQQLKAENEELKQQIKTYAKVNEEDTKEWLKCSNVLDEIEEVAKNGVKDDCGMPLDELSIILNIIKQVKKGE